MIEAKLYWNSTRGISGGLVAGIPEQRTGQYQGLKSAGL